MTHNLKLIITLVILALGANYVLAEPTTWVGPTAEPPGNNAEAPINVSSVAQIKSGPLGVGAFSVFGPGDARFYNAPTDADNTTIANSGNQGLSTWRLSVFGQATLKGGNPAENKVLAAVNDQGLATWKTLAELGVGGGTTQTTDPPTPPDGGLLSNVRYYTSSGSWQKPTNLHSVVVEVVGGGGAGAAFSGGSGGGYAMKRILAADLNETETVTVGHQSGLPQPFKGLPRGGTSSFGSHVSATGGGYGGDGGVGQNGDINLAGQWGQKGSRLISTEYIGGEGGDSPRGWGLGGVYTQPLVSAAGLGYGAGGSMTLDGSGIGPGNGSGGIVVVHEYIKP